jgi:hypothetical protein
MQRADGKVKGQPPECKAGEITEVLAVVGGLMHAVVRQLGDDRHEDVEGDDGANEEERMRFDQPGRAEPDRIDRRIEEHGEGRWRFQERRAKERTKEMA